MSGYAEFLETKRRVAPTLGREISPGEVHPVLFPFQRDLVRAAIDAGFAPVAPYLMTEGILHEPEDREIGLELDCAIIARCDELWFCGPVVSAGMSHEAEAARTAGIPVLHILSRDTIDPANERGLPMT